MQNEEWHVCVVSTMRNGVNMQTPSRTLRALLLLSISPTLYNQFFASHRLPPKIQTPTLSSEKLCNSLSYEKAVCKMLLKLTLGLISPNFVCQVKICRQIQGMAKKCHSNSSTSLCQMYGLKLDKFLCRSPSTICHKRRQICKCKSLAQILVKSRLGWQQRKNVGRGHAPSFPSSSLFGFSPVFLSLPGKK